MGNDEHGAFGRAQGVDAVRHRAQRVDVEAGIGLVQDAELRLEEQHLQHLVALLLTARETLVDRALHQIVGHLDGLHLLAAQLEEVHGVELGFAAMTADRIHGRPQEVVVRDARDFHRILEGEEDALARAGFGVELSEVLAVEEHLALRDLEGGSAHQHVGEGALAGSVGTHDGVHLTGTDREIDSLENGGVARAGVQPADLEEGGRFAHPTAPSRLTARRFWASTANSIGSSLKTSLQNPFTIMLMASSSEMPRWRQ